MKSVSKALLYLFSLFLIPISASAHIIGGSGFSSGAFHPFTGLDHLLAMIAVGIVSVQHKGKAIWIIPSTFLIFMLFGGAAGILGIAVPFVGIGIALSVLFLGLVIAFRKKLPLYLTMIFVAVSAVLHGHAHGTEIPMIANPVFYAVGFVLSTALLHATGVLTGYYASKTDFTSKMLRYAGAAMGAVGMLLLFGVIA